MRTLSVVIGANYGDEGKGLTTDYLASKGNSVVVRFNSSAQAGHTVETPDGRRHVFSHIGSGSFAGAATFLSPFFVLSPMFFKKELHKLRLKKCDPKIYVDGGCLITTPYDVMLNQAVEELRGNKKHGSCGMGFNETVVRSEEEEFRLTYMMDPTVTAVRLMRIISDYIPRRMRELGIKELPYLNDDRIFKRFLLDIDKMKEETQYMPWYKIKEKFPTHNIIFEGAQGLLLDMDGEDFPHVTRSKTGLYNIVRSLLHKAGLEKEQLDVYYITRTYLTRHGAGPLESEEEKELDDKTNIENKYQGKLRYAELDSIRLSMRIEDDYRLTKDLNATKNIVLTCCDHIKMIKPIRNFISNVIKPNKILTSWGPARDTIKGDI